MKFSIQLYSLRDCTKDDFLGTIEKVAQQGYDGVEFAGFYDTSAQALKAVLDQCGIAGMSTHTGLDALENDYDGMVSYLKTIGCRNFVLPASDCSSPEAVEHTVGLINKYIPRLKADGMTFLYHNHDFEFRPFENGKTAFEMLRDGCPDLLFEVDVYWAHIGTGDVVKMLNENKARVGLLHLKDGFGGDNQSILGRGETPIREVVALGKEWGLDWAVVEADNPNPDPMTFARESLNFLKSL